jgi:hypothetical protein
MDDDGLIKCKGMEVLVEHLGLVEAGRFVTLIKRERFDYTKWREKFYEGKTLEQIFNEAVAFQAKENEEEKARKLPEKSAKAKPAARTVRKPAAKRKTAGRKQLVTA